MARYCRVSALLILTTVWCCCIWPASVSAQEEEDILIEGMPLENLVAGRDLAVRLRTELTFTEDDDELIDTDISYKRFPSLMHDSEIKLFHKNGLTVAAKYGIWQNDQDLDTYRWGCSTRIPVNPDWRMSLTYLYYDQQDDPERTYLYVGFSRSFDRGLYSLTQYRHSRKGSEDDGNQLSEYVSWRQGNRFRIAGKVAVSQDQPSKDMGPWYTKLYTTIFLREEVTSLRFEAMHYDYYSSDLEYQEYDSYLYQRVGSQSLLRLGYRYYVDNDDHSSHAWGIKAKHFFSPRFSGHIGYRRYDHSDEADFDTVYVGIGLIL